MESVISLEGGISNHWDQSWTHSRGVHRGVPTAEEVPDAPLPIRDPHMFLLARSAYTGQTPDGSQSLYCRKMWVAQGRLLGGHYGAALTWWRFGGGGSIYRKTVGLYGGSVWVKKEPPGSQRRLESTLRSSAVSTEPRWPACWAATSICRDGGEQWKGGWTQNHKTGVTFSPGSCPNVILKKPPKACSDHFPKILI